MYLELLRMSDPEFAVFYLMIAYNVIQLCEPLVSTQPLVIHLKGCVSSA